MPGILPSSRRKKAVKSEHQSAEPIESTSQSKPTGKECNHYKKRVHVRVTKEDSINDYDSEHLDNITESTQSIEYESPATNRSFDRHVMEARMAKKEVLDIFHIGVVPVKSEKKSSGVQNSSTSLSTEPDVIETLDEPKFSNLVTGKGPPKHGVYQATSHPYHKALEEQKAAKESVVASMEEFFGSKQDAAALTVNIRRDGDRPLVSVKLGETTAPSDPSPILPTIVNNEVSVQMNSPSRVYEYRYCHKHVNKQYSEAPSTSLQNRSRPISSEWESLSSDLSSSPRVPIISLPKESSRVPKWSLAAIFKSVFSLFKLNNQCCRRKPAKKNQPKK